jgi:hypothetical protein
MAVAARLEASARPARPRAVHGIGRDKFGERFARVHYSDGRVQDIPLETVPARLLKAYLVGRRRAAPRTSRNLGDLGDVFTFRRFVRPPASDWMAEVTSAAGTFRWSLADLRARRALVANAPDEAAIAKLESSAPTDAQRAQERAHAASQARQTAADDAKADRQAAAIQNKSFWSDLFDELHSGALAKALGPAFKVGLALVAGVLVLTVVRATRRASGR